MSSLDPVIIRCAKQVYNNLRLSSRIGKLSNAKESYPPEVDKMLQLVLLSNTQKLESVVRTFLQNNKPNKNLQDFGTLLTKEITLLEAEINMADEDDEYGELDDQAFAQISEQLDTQLPKKRAASPTPLEDQETKRNRPLESIQTIDPVHCFRNDIQNESHNTICNPHGAPKMFEKVKWVLLFEISRFMQSFNIQWNQIPFDAYQGFINVGNSDPSSLYEHMIRWNQETRLGKKLNGLSYTVMDRCPESVWHHIKQLELAEHPSTPSTPQPSAVDANYSTKDRFSRLKNRMIHYSAYVNVKTSTTEPEITLRPPKLEASNRFYRKFGQDRFLELKLTKRTQPTMIKYNKDFFLKPFLFMYRIFRFLFIKDDTIVLFATEGNGLEPISIQQVIDWHMPITENWDMSMSKYASRMSLGYSSSIPTLEFTPEQILYVDDIYGSGSSTSEDACMTDGCGIISCSAMKKIMGCQATDELPCAIQGRIAGAKGVWIIAPDLDFSTGDYIKIRKSQNKFKTGIAQADFSLDPHHYTFDLVKNSIIVYPSNLNTQFIQCLSAGGVPTSVFVEILKEYIHQLASIVTENQSLKLLRDWVAKCGNVMMGRWEEESSTEKGLWRDLVNGVLGSGDDENDSGFFTIDSPDDVVYNEDEPNQQEAHKDDDRHEQSAGIYDRGSRNSEGYARLNKYSGFPAGLHESIIRLIDAGFDLSNAYIATRVTAVFRQIMQAITTKYKIEVPQSCTVTCVPDPTGTLEPGEVFLQLSSRRVDEKTGIRAGQILGDVIVTRNPCGLRSDVQKVKAVDNLALRMYTDLIIFSVKGETSLASQLSGGDYDGDIVFCCWDQRIVEPFQSAAVPPECDRVKQAFEKDNTSLGKEVGGNPDIEGAIQSSFISVAVPDGTLGQYENWRTVLAERTSLDNPDVIYLGQMCSKLVDAPKQGLHLKSTVKTSDRAKYQSIPHPAWFLDKRNRQRGPRMYNFKEVNDVYTLENAPCVTTMDNLYGTLLKETEAFTKYSRSMFCDDDVPLRDPDLVAPWINAHKQAAQLDDKTLKADLDLIATSIRKNREDYIKQCSEFDQDRQHYMDSISNPKRYFNEKLVDELKSRFNSHFQLEEFFAKEYLNAPMLESLKSSIMRYDIQANGGKMLNTIKASYAYVLTMETNKYSKYCYIVCYDQLRRIKADAVAQQLNGGGIAHTVATPFYKCMSIDRKWIKKLKESNYIEKEGHEVRLRVAIKDK